MTNRRRESKLTEEAAINPAVCGDIMNFLFARASPWISLSFSWPHGGMLP